MGFVLVFSNAEYRIALVDFIYSSRGRLERDRGFANPLSLSNTSPDPWGIRCGGEMYAAAVDRDLGFRYPVQTVHPQFRIWFGYLCSGLGRSRFSRVAQLGSFVFHWWGVGRSFLRIRGVLLWSIVGITANREWVVNLADKG